jgi:hypothetical protein
MRALVVVGLIVSTVPACGHRSASSLADAGAADADLGPPFGPVALADFSAKFREAYCRRLVRCGEVADLATCAQVNLRLVVIPPANPAEVAAGKTIYDPVQSGLCIDAVATASCDRSSESWRAGTQACLHEVAGTLHAGASCATNAECISGRCDKQAPRCSGNCCTGSCDGDTPPFAGLGAGCAHAYCDRGTYCDAQSITCQPLKPGGAPCDDDGECAYGLWCGRERSSDPATCMHAPRLGDPCYERIPCGEEGTFCSLLTGRCEKPALGGQSCREAWCSPLYLCDRTDTCSAGLAVGAACTSISRCADPDGFCDMALGQSTGVCAVPQPDGAACASGRNCRSEHCDASQHCAPATYCQ